jgi:hypothetical protein
VLFGFLRFPVEKGHGEKLSRTQERCISALLASSTIGEAAEQARVNVRTLRKWMKLRSFSDAYRAARAEVMERTITTLHALGTKAVFALSELLDSDSESVRARAVDTALSLILRSHETIDLEAKLDDIKRRLDEHKPAYATNGRM